MADRGAHYHRCDFQVHTPRDTNWKGERPATEEERIKYAADFIAACRKKGLDAVAITDHHDLAFFPYIKRATKQELDEQGNPISDEEKIIVFPGMELTLGVPCQALIILDAEFPESLLSTLLTILGISQNDPSSPMHVETSRLEHIKSINQLCQLLDTYDYLKQHYILLPNISDSGDFSLIRKGFTSHYKDMPCVGGYLDGSFDKLKPGHRNIVEGKVKEYGFKELGVFQTSDNRRADFSNLGTHSSWVKWAVPTAEALRQACLAHQTRISNTEPQLPSLVIDSMEVSNSKFLGPINIRYNPQLNSLIGGRGTGKSTILEYLRWALCDQPPALSDEEELPDFQKKRLGLINNTLLPLEAVATVSFLLNGIPHVVRRNARTKQLLLKVGTEEFRECHEDTIRDLLPVQAYSQKQLSTVGVRTEELIRFVKTPLNKSLREFTMRQEELKTKLRNNYAQIEGKRKLAREIEKEKLEIDSLDKQVKQLRAELKGLSEEDRNILAKHDAILEEEQVVEKARNTVNDWRQTIESTTQEIVLPFLSEELKQDTPNCELISQIVAELNVIHASVHGNLRTITDMLQDSGESIKKVDELRDKFSEILRVHTAKYEAAKARSSSHETRIAQISQAEKRLRMLKEGLLEKERRFSKYGLPENDYEQAQQQWNALYASRADILEERCRELTALSFNQLRATLRRGAGIKAVKERLATLIIGTRVRTKKVDDLCEMIATAGNPIEEWGRIQKELEQLAALEASAESEIELPACPGLRRAGLMPSELEKMARRFTVEEWLDLSLSELEDTPEFEYRQREGDYINFSDASAGQQATALLRVLLNQEGPPLIIDQPEEDLDNPVILEIVKDIWNAKAKRQIIFSSHNANIVVNGDADLVICCDYREAGDQSGGRIKLTGAIDMDDIRGEITKVMEGGKEAFRLRLEKYGF